jgi:signal transduction histidine kinase
VRHNLRKELQHELSTGIDLTRWVGSIGLAVAVGIAYFVAARLSLALLAKPEGVAVFWPAAGVATGVLIALGSRARWPVVVGTMVATIVANLFGDRNLWSAVVFAFCNAGEAVLTALLIEHYFGSDFRLSKLRNVLGLVVAAIIGAAVSGIGGAAAFKLFHSATTPMLTTWQHWFASDGLGIITVAPLLIELASASRDRLSRSELVEGALAVAALALVSGFAIFLRSELLATVGPVALVFAPLLWLAARCRPVFAAAAAFIVSLTIVWTTTFGIGYFGNPGLSMAERVTAAQVSILLVTIGALVLAALFAERREHEAVLEESRRNAEAEARSMMANLAHMNRVATAGELSASMAHELKQPLAAIVTNANAATRWLNNPTPHFDEVHAALKRIISEGHRASHVIGSIRAMFKKDVQARTRVDLNEIIREVLALLQNDFAKKRVTAQPVLTAGLPHVLADRIQLQQVILNLVVNAIEAMESVADRQRILHVRTEFETSDGMLITVQDSGPGIDPKVRSQIFDPFFTTKVHGMGMGLLICRSIVESHGGRLTVSNSNPHGSMFQIVLPIDDRTSVAP